MVHPALDFSNRAVQFASAIVLTLVVPRADAQPQLVLDVWPGAESSEPHLVGSLDDGVLFHADDGTNGRRLWTSDGTAEGTMAITHMRFDQCAGTLHYRFGRVMLVTADDGMGGCALYGTDGTDAGTELLSQVAPHAVGTDATARFAELGGAVYYAAATTDLGVELWRSDGTATGTQLIADINPGPSSSNPEQLVVLGGVLLFKASDGIHGYEIWKTDGTATELVKDIALGAADSLSTFAELVVVGDAVMFLAEEPTRGLALWRSDGTEVGTLLVKDIVPESSDLGFYPNSMFESIGGLAIFDHFIAMQNGGWVNTLWRSDGTVEGTMTVPGAPTDFVPRYAVSHAGSIWFNLEGAALQTLWRSDGTSPGTIEVNSEARAPMKLVGVQELVFFSGEDRSGRELWMTDGTPAGSERIDVAPGGVSANPGAVTAADRRVFFSATDGEHGFELWAYDPPAEPPPVGATTGAGGAPSDTDPVVAPVESSAGCSCRTSSKKLRVPWALWMALVICARREARRRSTGSTSSRCA